MNELWEAAGFDSAHRLDSKRLGLTPQNRLHIQYVASSSKEEQLVLTLVPSSTKVLRRERASIRAEATLLHWLSTNHGGSHPRKGQRNSETSQQTFQDNTEESKLLIQCSSHFTAALPRVIKHGRAKLQSDIEFLITKRRHGTVISSLTSPLSRTQQRCVDFQIGQLIREISTYEPPVEKFGNASAILEASDTHQNIKPLRRLGESVVNNDVYTCWSGAFLSLLESVLRDAEDVAVMLEYEKVRRHASRFKPILDEVTFPCLVILDAGEYFNTRIASSDDSTTQGLRDPAQRFGQTCLGAAQSQSAPVSLLTANQYATEQRENDESEPASWPASTTMHDIVHAPPVIDVQDWYNSIFGDPLFTSVLTKDENMDIWDGLFRPIGHGDSKAIKQAIQLKKNTQNANVRRLLYDCYHSVAAIVTEYYRMTVDSDDRELPARRRLVQALAKLNDLDDLGMKIK